MARTVLITGGAGFIGSHLADELLSTGCRVRALDSLSNQVHEPGAARPNYLDPRVELEAGDVTCPRTVARALRDVDTVYHFAAMVGVGQSMYEVDRYVRVNDLGTAVLLQCLIDRPVGRLVVASSMSIYGEGRYQDGDGRLWDDRDRRGEAIRLGRWDPVGDGGEPLVPVPTPEDKPPSLASVYALSKYVQERMCLIVGRTYGIPTVALRFFNVYGTRQALSNPYTGVLAIFGSRLLNGNPPILFEDGEQRRDFVHVADVTRACRLALESSAAAGGVFNVGSGESHSVREVAVKLAHLLGKPHLAPVVSGRHRAGDIRHCFADIGLARAQLGFTPRIKLDDGLGELSRWLSAQMAIDRFDQARDELAVRGLTA